MLANNTIQNYKLDYNSRMNRTGFLEPDYYWKQAAAPNSEKWNAVMNNY